MAFYYWDATASLWKKIMEENLYPNNKAISTQASPFPDKTWKKSVVKANTFWVLFKNPEVRNEIPPQILLKNPPQSDFIKDFVTVPLPKKLKLWHWELEQMSGGGLGVCVPAQS